MSNFRGALGLTVFSNGTPVQETLFSFLGLATGWHFGRGKPPTIQMVMQADMLASLLYGLGARNVEAFPGVDGGLTLLAFSGTYRVEVTINPNFNVDYSVDKDDIEVASDDGKTILEFVIVAREKAWLSSDFCIQNTTAKNLEGSPRQRSAIPMAPGYQSSANIACFA
jgi:hypothetical protein